MTTAALSPGDKERHVWFEKRREILAVELDRLLDPVPDTPLQILDAGCGGGLLLEDLSRRGEVTAVDADPAAVQVAAGRQVADVQLARVESLPFADASFDLITCFDVLEHASDDAAVLDELRRVARPAARLLLTVPALPWLWSPHDVASGHHRRYRRRALLRLASARGWEPIDVKSFNTILLAPIAAARLASRVLRRPPRSDLLTAPAAAEFLLRPALTAEVSALRRGVRLPVGLSLLASFRATR